MAKLSIFIFSSFYTWESVFFSISSCFIDYFSALGVTDDELADTMFWITKIRSAKKYLLGHKVAPYYFVFQQSFRFFQSIYFQFSADYFTFRDSFSSFLCYGLKVSSYCSIFLCSSMATMLVIIDISVWNGKWLHPFDGQSGTKH